MTQTEARKLQIAIPWNNSSYIPCNGFHPLYQSLFDESQCLDITFNVIDEPEFARLLLDEKYLESISGDVERLKKHLEEKWETYPIAKEFLDHVSVDDLWLTSQLPGDIEFHHTSPLTTGDRPFIFHCESFLPIFMPFAYQGKGFMRRQDELREFYGAMLADDNCQGIYSHLQTTLDQISRFFNNNKIDAKLGLTRIGLANNVYANLSGVRRDEFPDVPCFLFTGSDHLNPASFGLHGGYSVLLFAERYFREGKDGLFIFRCARPADAELEKFGIDTKLLHQAEKSQQVVWIEGYLPESEQLSLFKLADFFLVPSLNLHSVSIMQAQLAGAIPVASDTLGAELFVEDGRTGITLTGVRDAVWRVDPQTGIPCDDHSLWSLDLPVRLADQMYERVMSLLNNPNAFVDLRQGTRAHALEDYSGGKFREAFFSDVSKTLPAHPPGNDGNANKMCALPLLRRPIDFSNQLFGFPSAPTLLLALEHGKVYQLKGTYWFNPTPADTGSLRSWAPLSVAKNGGMGAGTRQRWSGIWGSCVNVCSPWLY